MFLPDTGCASILWFDGPTSYSFLDMKRAFLERPFGGDPAWYLTMAGLLILCCISLIMWLSIRRRRRLILPAGASASRAQIAMILGTALTQRSTFDLQFPQEQRSRRPLLRCSPENLAGKVLSLEAAGVQNSAPAWAGREVDCYFKITAQGRFVYYAFKTTIKDVELKKDSFCRLNLNLPERLENRQKRSFLRITPPADLLMGAAVWHGARMPAESLRTEVSQWPFPNLVYIPEKTRQFTLSDISAGGLRVRIAKKELLKTATEFNIGEQLIVLLDLLNPEAHKRLRFWLHCRVQNLAIEYDSQDMEMGLQFMAWATPKDGESNSVEWLRLTRNLEVDPLGNWIIRRHLELFRGNLEVGF